MKAVAICGSPRPEGNTETLLRKCLDALKSEGIETELIRIRDYDVAPCRACGWCAEHKNGKCVIDDDFAELFSKMREADIIVVGSPVYFGSATPNLMGLLDRAGFVSRMNGNLFSRKLGGAVAVARRAGENFTFAQLVYWFLINDMIVPGSTYWNVGIAREPGEVKQDTEAMETVSRFGENLAWLAKRLEG